MGVSKRTLWLGASMGVIGALTAPAFAQDDADNGLEDEIVVTTERRSQSLQDTAAVAKQIDGDDLRKQGLNSFQDLATVLPQLNIGSREGNVEVFIRGIGDDNNTELSEPRSAILLDGLYLSRPRGLGSFFFDIQSVELNVGPQGTLRGRNATGGSLNIITRKPDLGEFNGYVDVGLGNFAQREYQAALNVPLWDNAAIRFAGYRLRHNSKIENVGDLTDIRESREVDDLAGRVTFLWEPTERLSLELAGDYLDQGGTGFGGLDYFPFFQQQADGNIPSQEIRDLNNPRQVVTQGAQPVQDAEIWGIRGNAQYDFGNFTAEYIGGLRTVDYFFNRTASDAFFPSFDDLIIGDNRADFFDTFSRVQFDQRSQSIIQEVRLFANDDQRFRWTVGGFYFKEYGTASFATTADRSFVFAGVNFDFPDVDRENYAFYADGTYDITENFRLTGGVRYTNERLKRTGGFGSIELFLFPNDTSGTPPNTFNFSCCAQHRFGTEGFQFAGRNRTVFTEDVDLTTAEGRIALFLGGVAQFGEDDTIDDLINLLLTEGPNQTGFDLQGREISNITPNFGSRRDEFFDYRVRLEYDVTPDMLVYAGVSTGTNSGGFNDSVTQANQIITPEFDVEEVRVVEVGAKSAFELGGYRSIFNVAGFWYDYTDQQFTILAPAGAGVSTGMGMSTDAGLVSLRQNVGDSRILGFDVDYTQQLPGNLTFRTNFQYLDTEFTNASQALVDTRFNNPNGPADTIPFDPVGNRLPKASALSGLVSLSQAVESNLGRFDWIVSAGFRTDYFLTIFNGDGTLPTIDASTFPDLSADDLTALQNTVAGNAGSSRDRVPGYVRLDIGAGYNPQDNLRFELYVKNLTDTAYSQTSINSPGLNLRFLNDQRTFGGRVRLNF